MSRRFLAPRNDEIVNLLRRQGACGLQAILSATKRPAVEVVGQLRDLVRAQVLATKRVKGHTVYDLRADYRQLL